jgi:hypothetical protein
MYEIIIEMEESTELRKYKAKNKNEIIHILSNHLINSIGDYVNINGDCGWDFGKI